MWSRVASGWIIDVQPPRNKFEGAIFMARLAITLTCISSVLCATWGAHAQSPVPAAPDCAARATEKKLAGAALKSFMTKCERDAAIGACDAAATEKKLSGAARNSFTKKCVKDAATKPAAK